MGEKLFRREDFPDLLEKINLTSSSIVKQIENFHLTFSKERNNLVEWGMQLPMFVPAFYDFVLQFERVPDQSEFFNHYISSNAERFTPDNFDSGLMSGLQARAYRTYPSLVRDISFNKYVKEHIADYAAIYNIDLDVSEGIDLMLSKGELHYAINLFTQTTRAYQGRAKKKYRHTLFDNVKYIDFPVNFKGSFAVGDFFLYWETEYKQLINLLS